MLGGHEGTVFFNFSSFSDVCAYCKHVRYKLSGVLGKESERVTGRKARGLQTEERGCKCQTFLSLLSGRRKQTSDIFSSLYKFKRRFLSLKMLCCHDTWFHLKLTALKPWVNQYISFSYGNVVLSYDSIFKLVPPDGPTYLLRYCSPNLCKWNYLLVICPSTRFKSIILWLGMNYLVPF